jgi:RNA recognition motif. (a.k.a. RRM, RBD, or RNP domain)
MSEKCVDASAGAVQGVPALRRLPDGQDDKEPTQQQEQRCRMRSSLSLMLLLKPDCILCEDRLEWRLFNASFPSAGYGFVSFRDPATGAKALREMDGKYVGNRPCKLRKSSWEVRVPCGVLSSIM